MRVRVRIFANDGDQPLQIGFGHPSVAAAQDRRGGGWGSVGGCMTKGRRLRFSRGCIMNAVSRAAQLVMHSDALPVKADKRGK
jgi:hypothetical protein